VSPDPEALSVGFIGLGAMGDPMVRRLAASGVSLGLYDADPVRSAGLAVELGAHSATSLADLAQGAAVLITMLPNSAIVETVLAEALPHLAPGALVLEMSSGHPIRTRALADVVAASGGTLCDAPVSGGVPRARSGDLAIMLGGPEEACARAEPILRHMGSSIQRTGPVGSAHAMKALNNLVSAGGFLIGIEALLIGSKFGLDPDTMVDILNASTGMNNSTQKKFKQFVLSRAFNAGFGLDLMVKDLGIATSIAAETGTTAPFSTLCHDIWGAGQKALGPGQDHTALARFCEMIAGAELIGSDG
jgi:3-hydroxyisobutyrate dehydrogenase